MTIPSTPRRAGPFTGTGLLVSYPFTFKVFAASDLLIAVSDTNGLETTLVLDSGYSVSLSPDQDATPGGSVTYEAGGVPTALPTGYKLTITGGGLPLDQPADLPQGGNFNPVVVENALDRLEMQIQNQAVELDRTLQTAITSPVSLALPAPVAGQLLGWNATLDGLVNYAPDASSAAGLQIRLANPGSVVDGMAMLARGAQVVDSIAALRLLPGANPSKYARVQGYYAPGDGGGGDYYRDAADLVSADNGGTVIVAADGGRWKLARQLFVSMQQFGARFNGSSDDTTLIQKAIDILPGGILYAPPATTVVSTLDGRAFYGTIFGGSFGDGLAGTTLFKGNTAGVSIFNFNNATDLNPRPYTLRNLSIDGNGLANTIGINARYRHQTWMENIFVRGCTVGVKQLDTYTCHESNVRTAANGTGRWKVGSDHASTHKGGGSDTNTVCNLLIQTNGTPADGNEALSFEGFVTQSSVGSATNIDITCSSASFKACYFGENSGGREAITQRGGNVMVDGGVMFTGNTATSYGITPLAGRTVFRGTKVNGQAFGGIDKLIGGTTNGKVAFYDVAGGLIVSGNPVWDGDPLDYGPQGTVYCKRLGKSWTSYAINATLSTALVGNNGRRVTCLTAPGPSAFVGLSTPLAGNADWRDGEPLSLLLIYASNTALEFRLSGSAGAGAPSNSVGNPPSTGGAIKTYVKLDFAAASTAWVVAELYKFSGAPGDQFDHYECILGDSRTINKLASQFGNLCK